MQAQNRVADGVEHAAHLPVSAFVDRQLDRAGREPDDARGRGRAVVELDPGGEPGERGVGRLALDDGDVDLLDLVARVGQPVRERAVVRQEQRAGRVGVEPADGDDAARVVDELDYGRAAAGIAGGGDDARRLV